MRTRRPCRRLSARSTPAGQTLPEELQLGDLYDQLAELAAEEEDFALAIRAQRKAIKIGWDYLELAREMLAWYLLKDGQRAAGEAAFSELRAERADDVWLLLTIGSARLDSGDENGALAGFDEALAMAKRSDDEDLIYKARAERRGCREEMGLEPDDDDLQVRRGAIELGDQAHWSVAWFPRDEAERAITRWPGLRGDLEDRNAYCRSIEGTLRQLATEFGRRPSVAPIRVLELAEYADSEDLDPDSGPARSRFAAELHRRGDAIAWPPGRNDPCWCGSGRKYKRCCGAS